MFIQLMLPHDFFDRTMRILPDRLTARTRYQNLLEAAKLPAWQKYKNFGGAAPRRAVNWGLSSYAPGGYAAFRRASVTSKDNLFQNNSFCTTCVVRTVYVRLA